MQHAIITGLSGVLSCWKKLKMWYVPVFVLPKPFFIFFISNLLILIRVMIAGHRRILQVRKYRYINDLMPVSCPLISLRINSRISINERQGADLPLPFLFVMP